MNPLQKLTQKLEVSDQHNKHYIIKSSQIDKLIGDLVENQTLHEFSLFVASFADEQEYKDFLKNINAFEQRIQHYFADYCKKNQHHELLNNKMISIKGYYVENKEYHKILAYEPVAIMYVELLTVSNKDSVNGLYHWEDKLNGLRTSSDSDGLFGSPDTEGDDIPF